MTSSRKIPWDRVVKCGISLAVHAGTTLKNSVGRLFGMKPAGFCVILNYHSIPAAERALFASQMDLLVRYSMPVRADTMSTLQPGTAYAAVTFDDGFENFIDEALPELRARNIPSTMFIIVDALGKEFGPEEHLEKVMSARQMRELPEDFVAIGSHTLTHPFVPNCNRDEAERELLNSRIQLEQLLGRPVTMFSFPFGGFSAEGIELCRKAGYSRIFTALPYNAFQTLDEFVVGRCRADTSDWPLEIRLKLAGAYRWLPWAIALKRKVFSAKRSLSGSGKGAAKSDQKVPEVRIGQPVAELQDLPKPVGMQR
jgi:peptidoglycan/xylan/chitin deacetylase (PgdA/CDA1 family)